LGILRQSEQAAPPKVRQLAGLRLMNGDGPE
jgi:hypothetical protein